MTISDDDLAALNAPTQSDPQGGEAEANPQPEVETTPTSTPAGNGFVLTKQSLGGLKIEQVASKETWMNVLIYGEAGVGKTVLSGSASAVSDMAPALLIDIEGGSMSLRKWYPNVEVLRIERWEHMQTALNELIMTKGGGYRTVILDSLTEIQAFNMRYVMRQLKESGSSQDEDIAGIREWGKNLIVMQRLIRGFRDLPMHTIFTALVREDRNKNGLPIKKPALQGQIGGQAPAFVDIVGYYYVKRVGDDLQRLLLTMKTDDIIAKDRSGRLPPVLVEPTMQALWTAVVGSDNGEQVTPNTNT